MQGIIVRKEEESGDVPGRGRDKRGETSNQSWF